MRFIHYNIRYIILIIILFLLFIWIRTMVWYYKPQKQITPKNLINSRIPMDMQYSDAVLSSDHSIKKTSKVVSDRYKIKGNDEKPKEEVINETINEIIVQSKGNIEDKIDNSVTTEEYQQAVIIPADAVKVELERGKKYRITSYGVGTLNPRLRTKEEQEAFDKLTREWASLSPLGASSKERRLKISEELNKINSETSFPSKTIHLVWFPLPGQDEPPDSEIIDIDMGTVLSPLWFVPIDPQSNSIEIR